MDEPEASDGLAAQVGVKSVKEEIKGLDRFLRNFVFTYFILSMSSKCSEGVGVFFNFLPLFDRSAL